MLETIIEKAKYIAEYIGSNTTSILLTLVTIYGILMKIVKRANKDKEEIVPFIDFIINMPLKILDARYKYHEKMGKIYDIKSKRISSKDKYKEHLKNRRQKKRRELLESIKTKIKKIKTWINKLREKHKKNQGGNRD